MCDVCVYPVVYALVEKYGVISFFIFGPKRVWEWVFIVCFNMPIIQLILGGFGGILARNHSGRRERARFLRAQAYIIILFDIGEKQRSTRITCHNIV